MANTIKINVEKELGIKKDFDVATSNINVEGALKMQYNAAVASDIEEKTGAEILEMNLKSLRDNSNYVKNILKLTEKQCALVDEMSTLDTAFLVNRICLRIMGNSDEEIEAIYADIDDGDLGNE